ncbi:MAG TPA: amidohydrolase family protein [Gammaproteobacteria bacterium]|jgi:predicted TIM-barrel fold metal-dependent hydrolase|nr:amidohydrolase family protein [Gammaproteobacteria bacterium]
MKKFLVRSFVLIVLGTIAYNYLIKDESEIEYGITIDGVKIDTIDMHLHTGTWEALTEPYKERYSERVPKIFRFLIANLLGNGLKTEGILKQMDNAGIQRAGVFAVYSPDTTGIASNEFLYEQIKDQPDRMFGFYSIRTDHWNLDAQQELDKLEKDLVQYNATGIKLAHAHQQMRLDDKRFDGIYEIAQRLQKPLYIHTGTSPNPYTRMEPPYVDPLYLEDSIKRFPNAKFILGHSGYDSYLVKLTYLDSCIELAKKYDNVFIEPGALGSRKASEILPDYLRIMKEEGLVDRVIYGSDGPQFPGYTSSHLENMIEAMASTGYTGLEMKAVLEGNFEKVFDL